MNTVEKTHLHPPAPPLTRFKEAMFPISKKKVVESIFLDEEVDEKLKGLTTVKLCVRLNTLQVSPHLFKVTSVCHEKNHSTYTNQCLDVDC